MNKDRPKVAINVFVTRENKLLLGQRKNTTGDGFWGLPGGHLEYMESLTEGAARELLEETGLVATKLHFINLVNDPQLQDNTHYLHIGFLAEGIMGEPELKEPDKCYEWRWFELDDLPENIFIGHRHCIPAFLNKTMFNDLFVH